jgi:hypothetical protein
VTTRSTSTKAGSAPSNALVIQSENDGNHCIEADGIGSFSSLDQATIDDFIARGLHTQATINNLTCIISRTAGGGTHGQGAGWQFREGHGARSTSTP